MINYSIMLHKEKINNLTNTKYLRRGLRTLATPAEMTLRYHNDVVFKNIQGIIDSILHFAERNILLEGYHIDILL